MSRTIKYIFNPKLFNPLYWHLMELLTSIKIRFIFIEGGSSAAKTFTICQCLLLQAMFRKKSTVVFRRFHVDIKDSVYETFKLAAASLNLTGYFIFQSDLIKSKSGGGKIVFKGLDNPERIKGIEGFDFVYNNEWNQFIEDHWKQQRKRLRGREGQKFICDWNPVSSKLWLYENWIDKEVWTEQDRSVSNCPSKYSALDATYSFKRLNFDQDMVNIKVTYRDNYWVVGHPSGKGGFVDIETLKDFARDKKNDNYAYRVYANGERGVVKQGGEFFNEFNPDKHIKTVAYEVGALHVTCDQNVDPYCSVGIWQMFNKDARQIAELPCKEPNNRPRRAADQLISYMQRHEHQDTVYVYGDPHGTARGSNDEDGQSWFDNFINQLRVHGYKVTSRIGRAAPQVSLSGDFVNDIYKSEHDGYTITISDTCKVSIDDYMIVKRAPDGTMLKLKERHPITQKMYEPNGHFSDTKRYLLTEMLKTSWLIYKTRHKRSGSIAGGRA